MKRFAGLLLAITLAAGLLTGVSAVTPMTEPAAAASYVSKKYTSPKKGETNKGVKALQRRLVAAKTLNRKWVNGHFNTKTENGVKRFQKKYDLKADGKVTRKVWNLLVKKTGKVKITKPKPKTKIAKRCKTDGRVLCIDKTRRKLYYVKKSKIIKTLDARFGCASTRTREGTFRVYRKNRHWTSTIYHTPMPYSMFFSGGQAVHYSADFKARGYSGCSHGCVNVRAKSTIRYVFKRIRVGDKVVVYRS